jgi:hypothetical protein
MTAYLYTFPKLCNVTVNNMALRKLRITLSCFREIRLQFFSNVSEAVHNLTVILAVSRYGIHVNSSKSRASRMVDRGHCMYEAHRKINCRTDVCVSCNMFDKKLAETILLAGLYAANYRQ